MINRIELGYIAAINVIKTRASPSPKGHLALNNGRFGSMAAAAGMHCQPQSNPVKTGQTPHLRDLGVAGQAVGVLQDGGGGGADLSCV